MLYKKTFKLEREKNNEDCDLKLLVIGGMHGNESNAVDIVSRLYNKLTVKYNKVWWYNTRFSEVTIVNAVNYSGLKYNQREFFQEELEETNDLNRIYNTETFPTKEDIMAELEQEILKHDVIVDVHNTSNIQTCISISVNENTAAYVDWALRNDVRFILTDDKPTLKRHADIDFEKVAFTYEFTDMGNYSKDYQFREWETIALEKFLAKIGDPINFEKNFSKTRYKEDKNICNVFAKKCTNHNLIGVGKFENFKMRAVRTNTNGLYSFDTNNYPLHNYVKHNFDDEYDHIATVVDPITRQVLDFIYPPCDGWLVDIPDTYWCSKGGYFGDFQPFLPKTWIDFYKEDNKNLDKF